MLVFRVMVAGSLQDPPDGGWRHVQHADETVKDPFRAKEALTRADQSRHAATGFFGAVAVSSPGQTVTALGVTRRSLPGWASRAAVDRLDLVSRFHTALQADADAVIGVLTAEGTPLAVARGMVAGLLADTHPTVVAMAVGALETRLASSGRVVSLRRVPHGGVVLQPDPRDPAGGVAAGVWALATGNSLVVNCPPTRPLSTAYLFHRLVHPLLVKAGAPGVLSVLSGAPVDTMADALNSSACNLVWYVGGHETGRWLQGEAQALRKAVVLDLNGGCDGVLVWRDADVPAAVQCLTERFHASGQLTMAPRYALVHPAVGEQLVDLLVERAQAMLPGLPSWPATLLSPLEDRAGFERAVEQAVTRGGARLATGGRLVGLDGTERFGGPFAEPTVAWASIRDADELSCIDDLDAAYPVMPVVLLDQPGDDAERLGQAVRFMNARLGAVRNTLWAAADDVIALFAADVRAGGILAINDGHLRHLPGLPSYGGTRHLIGATADAAQPWIQATRLQAVADATALGGRGL